jgi:hypothetical protein
MHSAWCVLHQREGGRPGTVVLCYAVVPASRVGLVVNGNVFRVNSFVLLSCSIMWWVQRFLLNTERHGFSLWPCTSKRSKNSPSDGFSLSSFSASAFDLTVGW